MRKVLEQGGTGSQHVHELAVPALWKERWVHACLSAWVSWEWHRYLIVSFSFKIKTDLASTIGRQLLFSLGQLQFLFGENESFNTVSLSVLFRGLHYQCKFGLILFKLNFSKQHLKS